jgi:serine protease inhibitor
MKRVMTVILLLVSLFTFILGMGASAATSKPDDIRLSLPDDIAREEPAANRSTDLKALVNANSKFAFDIFKQLNSVETGKNIFISPLSISTALAMLYQGAGSDTGNEIAKTLNYDGMDLNTLNGDYQSLLKNLNNVDPFITLNIENSIWYRDGFHVKPGFLSTNQDVFGAEIMGLDFNKADAADTINHWISEATNGMIEKMLDPPLVGTMYLIDAIYFKGAWTIPFNPQETKKSTFTTESGRNNTVDMMQAYRTIEFGKGTDYSVIRLPYGEKKVSMYCILPAKGLTIENLITGLSVDKFNEIKQSLSTRNFFSVKLPKFKMAYGAISLKTGLNRLGMIQAFDPGRADFSGITDGRIWVDDVLHKAVIDLNEQGTEAAATTIVILPTAMADNFHADRPFVFLIVDDTTGSILFMGKAADLIEY